MKLGSLEGGKVVADPQLRDEEKPADERLAILLVSVANSVMECVKMEADWPSKNRDGKMPILEMKVWTDTEGMLMYQHYEKDVCSKTVLNAKSAHSASDALSIKHYKRMNGRLLQNKKSNN